MSKNKEKRPLKSWSPATYRIEVEGRLMESWAEGFAGMRITTRKRADQFELTGVLNGLVELHPPIFDRENLDENNDGA